MGSEETRERFDSAVITCILVTAVLWGLLNWPWEYVATAHTWAQPRMAFDLSVDFFAFNGIEKTQAGFPFKYWMQEPDDETGEYAFWSLPALIVNVLLGLLVVAAAGGIAFLLSNHRNPSYAREIVGSVRFRMFGSLLSLVILAAACGTLYLRNEQERQLEDQVSQHAVTVSYAVIPKPLAGMTPRPLLRSFTRLRAVALCRNSPETLAAAIATPTVHTIGTHRIAPTAEQVRQLAKDGRIKHLLVRHAKIDAATKSAIFQATSLRRLDLINCRGVEEGWEEVRNLFRLQALILTDTDLRLALLPSDGWPPKLNRMFLPRMKEGADSVTLRGLKSLTTLNVQRMDAVVNRELLRITLEDLPRLDYLGLETTQRISLRIKSAPRLRSIGYTEQDSMQRSMRQEVVPASLWLRELHLDGVYSLEEVSCDGLDLKEVTLRRAPNLRRISLSRFGYQGGMVLRKPTASTPMSLQMLVNSLAKCDGPVSLDLSSLPLGGVDLTPLAQNKRIRRLELVNCGIEGKQSTALARLTSLTELDLRQCPITDADASRLLSLNVNLNALLVSSQSFSKIEVVDQTQLRGFVSTDSPNARVVNIANSPQLEVDLVLGDNLEVLKVHDGRSITGVSVDGPIPKGCELHGLRALKFFAIGGKNANDELCKDVWQCRDLDHLTIAYGSLSKQSLKHVGRLDRLTVLSLPGSDLDDEIVTQHWADLTMLSDINLSETKISSRTVAFAAALKNLQKLSIAYCDVKPEDLNDLTEVGQLIELDVAGIGITPDCLSGCLRRGMMDRLDLSDSHVSNELIDVLVSSAANSLLFLGLKNCKLGDAEIDRIIDAHPRLVMDLDGTAVSGQMLARLSEQRRLLDRTDRIGFLRHLATGEVHNSSDLQSEFDPVRGRIDLQHFSGKHLATLK